MALAGANNETLRIIVDELTDLKKLSISRNVEMTASELVLLLAYRRKGILRWINLGNAGFPNIHGLSEAVDSISEVDMFDPDFV